MDSVISMPLAAAIGIAALLLGLVLRRLLLSGYRLLERYLLPARYLAYRGKRTRTAGERAADRLAES